MRLLGGGRGESEVHRRGRDHGTTAAVSAWTRRRQTGAKDVAVAWPRGRRRKMRTRARDGRGGYDAAAAARDGEARAVADAAAGRGDGRAARVEAVRPDAHQGEARPSPRSLAMKSVEFYKINTNIINQSQHSVRSNILARARTRTDDEDAGRLSSGEDERGGRAPPGTWVSRRRGRAVTRVQSTMLSMLVGCPVSCPANSIHKFLFFFIFATNVVPAPPSAHDRLDWLLLPGGYDVFS